MVSEASGDLASTKVVSGRIGGLLWTASSRSTCAETNRAPTLVEQTREIARRANISAIVAGASTVLTPWRMIGSSPHLAVPLLGV